MTVIENATSWVREGEPESQSTRTPARLTGDEQLVRLGSPGDEHNSIDGIAERLARVGPADRVVCWQPIDRRLAVVPNDDLARDGGLDAGLVPLVVVSREKQESGVVVPRDVRRGVDSPDRRVRGVAHGQEVGTFAPVGERDELDVVGRAVAQLDQLSVAGLPSSRVSDC